jgi:hypothetical protein
MNMDGATDFPLPSFGIDGRPREQDKRSMYDDRSSNFGHTSAHRPPPPMPSYRSPCAETERSQSHSRRSIRLPIDAPPFSAPRASHPLSRYSEPTSPGARPVSIPSEAFQYGSGPIPAGPMIGSERSFYHTRPASAVAADASSVDPSWLNELLTKAVKRGVEESRRNEPLTEIQTQHTRNVKTASQPPGAWPESPFGPDAQPVESPEPDSVIRTNHSDSGWGGDEVPKKMKTRVNRSTKPDWGSPAKTVVWSSPDEPFFDTWNTDETWGTEKPKVQRARQWDQSKPLSARSRSESRHVSPVTQRHRQPSRFERHGSHNSRSKSRSGNSRWVERRRTSSKYRNGWDQEDATSDSSGSTDSTLRSLTHVRDSRGGGRSKKGSKRTRSAHTKSNKSSFNPRSGADSHTPSMRMQAPSVDWGPPPTVLSGNSFQQMPVPPPHVARKASSFAVTAPPAPHAPPVWVPETYNPPAPFGVAVDAFTHKNHESDSYPEWDSLSQDGADKNEKAKSSQSRSWQDNGKSAPAQDSWVDSKDVSPNWDTKAEDSWGETDTGGKREDHWGMKKTSGDGQGAGETDGEVKSISKQDTKDKESNGWGMSFDFGNTKKDVTTNWETTADAWNNNDSPKGAATKEKSVAWNTTADAWNSNPKSNGFTANEADTPWDTKDNNWNNDQPNGVQRAETWAPASNSPKPSPKAASTSKRHTSKSLSQYRQHRFPSSAPGPKSHWQFPPCPSGKLHPSISERTVLSAEPLLKISSKQASEKGVEHQVRAGTGTQYGHAISRPEYLDTLEKPYAVFRFKYRSRAILKDMFGDAVPDTGHLSERTLSSKIVREKEKLKEVSKEELIEKMVRLKMRMEEKEGMEGKERKRAVSENTETVARGLTEEWVRLHSGENSEKGRKEKEKEKGWSDPNKWM